jgi:hypothetical protein
MAIAIAMSALFAISYSLALGRLMPHHIPGVVGDPQSRPALVNALEAATRGGLDLHPLRVDRRAERTLANSGSIRRSYSPGRAASDPEDRVFFYVMIGQLPEDQRSDTRSGDVDRTRDSDIGRVQVVQLPASVRRGAMAETEVVLM